jgi:hypothetical protein
MFQADKERPSHAPGRDHFMRESNSRASFRAEALSNLPAYSGWDAPSSLKVCHGFVDMLEFFVVCRDRISSPRWRATCCLVFPNCCAHVSRSEGVQYIGIRDGADEGDETEPIRSLDDGNFSSVDFLRGHSAGARHGREFRKVAQGFVLQNQSILAGFNKRLPGIHTTYWQRGFQPDQRARSKLIEICRSLSSEVGPEVMEVCCA